MKLPHALSWLRHSKPLMFLVKPLSNTEYIPDCGLQQKQGSGCLWMSFIIVQWASIYLPEQGTLFQSTFEIIPLIISFFNFLLRIRQMTCWSENDRLIIREITRKQEWLCCITFSPCLGFFSTQTICFYCKINMLHKLHTKQKTQVIHQWEMFQTTLIHHGQIFDFIRTLNQTD